MRIAWNKGLKTGKPAWNTGLRNKRVECICKVCNKKFEEFESGIQEGRGKFCSRECWFETVWKGEEVKYPGLHQWVIRKLGQPTECEFCHKQGTGRQMQWANKSNLYKRDISDWIRLCVSCHKKYDLSFTGERRVFS